MRRWFIFLAVCCAQWCFGQEWKGHYSYNDVKDISFGNNILYVSAENAFFRFGLLTQDLSVFSTINGLSGETITASLYDGITDHLVLGHDNGLFEIVSETTGDVLNVIEILEKPTISPDRKRINHFLRYGDFLYISSDFGISLYDLERLEFDDTYFIGPDGSQVRVRQTTVFEGYLYASTDQGVFRAMIGEDDLIDFNQWEVVQSGNWVGIQAFSDELYAIDSANRLFREVGSTFVQQLTYSSPLSDLKATDEYFIVANRDEVFVYDTSFDQVFLSPTFQDFPEATYATAYALGDQVFLGTTEFGILRSRISNVADVKEIHPQGPLRNKIFHIKSLPDRLWAVYGDYTLFLNPFPLDRLGISRLEGGFWEHIPFLDTFDTRTIVKITPNPLESNQVFLSSFYSGLLQLDDNSPTIRYDQNNSGLESLVIPGGPPVVDIRVGDSKFDAEGNLWVINSRVAAPLKVLTTGGQWISYDFTDIIPDFFGELGFPEMVIDRNGFKFIAATNSGLLGFYENNGSPLLRNIVGENSNLPDEYVRSLALDRREQLWIGTRAGLRVLFNPSSFFNEDEEPVVNEIITLVDGQPSELLFQEFVSDIIVDGSDNKWLGTADSGAFYVSRDGRETMYHFTKDNSPLPSNSINAIDVDPITGEVFFATERGMVSFQGRATEPSDNLSEVYAFPNPVRPGFVGNVTIAGLVRRANIKITDIEGNLVYETTSQGGSVQWDLTAFGKYKVASGVYVVLIINDDGTETATSKIMVIR